MKLFSIAFFCLFSQYLSPQNIPTIFPEQILEVDFSEAFLKNFNSEKSFANCEKVYQKLQQKNYQLTADDEKILSLCDETKESPWEVLGGGCSWYCNGGGDSVTASSQLKSQGKFNYHPGNAHDLDYATAWIEGVPGHGIGEYLTYHFRPTSNVVEKIIIINGYVKSQAVWENNTRIKKLKVYVDGIPIAILELEDKRAEQYFPVKAIHPKKDRFYTLKFEIMEVYPGKKYEDAVITDIFFDGPSH